MAGVARRPGHLGRDDGVRVTTAVVLGGGGVTGIAWEIGVLLGLADAGIDLTDADLIVGTSAGSVVAAQITSPMPLTELFDRQIRGYTQEIAAKIGSRLTFTIAFAMLRHGRSPERFRSQIGRMALSSETVNEDDRFAVVSSRLPSLDWPGRDLRITACDAESGEFRVFTRDDGVPLAKAVAASCAVPGVWPCVTIDGRRYMDGGMCSPANANLAAGFERIVVLAPISTGMGPLTPLSTQVAELRAGGAHVVVVEPDQAATVAIGANSLDPARRGLSATAGRAQGATITDTIRAAWTPSA